ncbi:hypothetical protein IGI04_015126, partial [Brassica rapa subsp. trilocularis]
KSNFLEARSYKTSSLAWRSIVQTQKLIQRGARWLTGVWRWGTCLCMEGSLVNDEQNSTPTGPGTSLFPDLLLKDLFIAGTKLWDVQKIQNLVQQEDVSRILTLTIRPSWFGAHDVQNSLISKLWKLKIPPKLKIFWWKILHNGL